MHYHIELIPLNINIYCIIEVNEALQIKNDL